MGRLYKSLGLQVGVIVHDLDDQERKDAYNADITYGTNNEFGFDYLRDNMKFRLEDCVQRGHHYAIVDEVDSILIDEARTPLIISGPSEESTDKYYKVNRIIPKLVRGEVIEGKEPGEKYTTGDYTVDEKHTRRGAHRRGRAQGREAAQPRQPVRSAEHRVQPPRAAGAQRARPLPARPRLRGEGRR